MKSTMKLISAMTAAMLMLAGCGSVENENNSGAAQAVSETVTSASQEAEAPDSSESEPAEKTNAPAESTKYKVAGGFEKCVGYKPSDEEIDTLTELAREQYNAILDRDAEAYFRTLNIRELFDHGDYKGYREALKKHDGEEGYSDVWLYAVRFEDLIFDKATIDNPGFATGEFWADCEDDWDEEDPDTWTPAEQKSLNAYQQALDSMDADYFRTADPYSENLAGMELTSDYFYPVYYSDRMDGFKTVGSGAVCTGVTLYSTLKYDGGKYIEFSADFTDGSETVHIPHVVGWIKDGQSGASLSLTEWTIYGMDRSAELSDEQVQALIKLGTEQYNAIVTRDAEAYLNTLGLEKALEGLTKEKILELWESYECDLPMGFALVLDCAAYKDPSLVEPFNNGELLAEKYDNDQQKAARAWYEAAADQTGNITPELVAEMDKDEAIRNDLISNYFTDYDYLHGKYGELSPVAAENVYADEDPSADKNDDGTITVSMYLRCKNDGEPLFIGRLEGIIYEDGSMGVYLYDIIPEDGGEEENIDDANRGD